MVDTDQRHAKRRQAPRNRQHRSIAAEHDREICGAGQRVVGYRVNIRDARGSRRVRVERYHVTAVAEERDELGERYLHPRASMAADQRDAMESGGNRGGHRAIKP